MMLNRMNLIPFQTTKITAELRECFASVEELFDFEYPIFTQEHKAGLEKKIYNHYCFRQIGQETPARFKHYLAARMNEIMPYYIQLLESELIKNDVDIFDNYLLVEEFTRTVEGTSSQTGTATATATATDNGTTSNSATTNVTESGSSTNKTTVDGESENTLTHATDTDTDVKVSHTENKTTKNSDTPQGSLSNLDNYLTNASIEDASTTDHNETVVSFTETQGVKETHAETTDNTGSSEGTRNETVENETTSSNTAGSTSDETSSMTGSDKQTETYTINRHGNIGVQTFGDELQKYRDILLNIDVMIIENLADLFLGVY